MTRTILFAIAFLALFSGPAWAQFAGDVFFADPSVSAPRNEPVTLRIQTFSGGDVLGGAHFVLRFDPARLAIDAVRPGEAAQLQDALVTAAEPGRVGVVTLNGTSLQGPFGTIDLVEVVARPLAPAGEEVTLDLEVVSLVDGESLPFVATRGFGAEISVTSAGATLQGASPGRPPDADDEARAKRLRRPGYTVRLLRALRRGLSPEAVAVRVADFRAPSD